MIPTKEVDTKIADISWPKGALGIAGLLRVCEISFVAGKRVGLIILF